MIMIPTKTVIIPKKNPMTDIIKPKPPTMNPIPKNMTKALTKRRKIDIFSVFYSAMRHKEGI